MNELDSFLVTNDIRETTVLNKNLNVLAQYFFDSLRCLDFSQTSEEQRQKIINLTLKIYILQHWVRMLTAGTIISYLLQQHNEYFERYSQQIYDQVKHNIKNTKREVRDATACIISNLGEIFIEQFFDDLKLTESDVYEYREGLSMLVGYCLKKETNQKALDTLLKNLQFKAPLEINTNYVHWYSQRAITKYLLAQGQNVDRDDTLYELIKQSFQASEMKVRKSTAEAAGIYYALYDDDCQLIFAELDEILNNMNETELNYKTHTVLMAATVFIQTLSGTQISFKIQSIKVEQSIMIELQQKLIKIYNNINDQFIKLNTLNNIYKSALIGALIPEPIVIKKLLDYDSVMSFDGGINASLYMQRFFGQSILDYKLQLLLLTQHNSKAISVLALKAIYFKQMYFDQEEIDVNQLDFDDIQIEDLVKYVVKRSASKNPDIRQAACKLLIQYINQQKLEQEDFSLENEQLEEVIDMLVVLFKNEQFKKQNQSMNAIKSAADLLECICMQFNQQQIDTIDEVVTDYIVQRDECLGNLAKYLVKTKNTKLVQFLLIYAYDAINVQLGEACKIVLPVASQLFDEKLLIEAVQTLLEEDNLILNGFSRLLFALKYYKNIEISSVLIQLCDGVLTKADGFFEEITQVYEGYLKVLKGETADLSKYEFKLDSKVEFDPCAFQTASYLINNLSQKENMLSIIEIITNKNKEISDYIQKICQEVMYETSVQQELKQLLICSLIDTNEFLPPPKQLDIKKNEVFDFDKING